MQRVQVKPELIMPSVSDNKAIMTPAPSVPSLSASLSKEEGDYVWDVFYQRSATSQDIFTPSSSASGNIATL